MAAAAQDGGVELHQLLSLGLRGGAFRAVFEPGASRPPTAPRTPSSTTGPRDAQLAVAGYRVIRYTGVRLIREPATVARELRSLLQIG